MERQRSETEIKNGHAPLTEEEIAYAVLCDSRIVEQPERFRRGVTSLALLLAAGIIGFTILDTSSSVNRAMPDPNPENVYRLTSLMITDENLRWERGLRDILPPQLVTDEPFVFETSGPLDVRERPNFQSRVIGQIEKGRHKGLYLLADRIAQWCGIKFKEESLLPDGVAACNSEGGTIESLFLDPKSGLLGNFPPTLVKYAP